MTEQEFDQLVADEIENIRHEAARRQAKQRALDIVLAGLKAARAHNANRPYPPEISPMPSASAYRITCSCGDTTIVRSGPDEIYVPDSSQWKFNTAQYWHCGRAGHVMASSEPIHLQEKSS